MIGSGKDPHSSTAGSRTKLAKSTPAPVKQSTKQNERGGERVRDCVHCTRLLGSSKQFEDRRIRREGMGERAY